MAFTVLVQVLIVQYGGDFAQTRALTFEQWQACFVIGFVSLPYGFFLRFISVSNEGEHKEDTSVSEAVVMKVVKGKGEDSFLWALFRYFVLPYAVIQIIKYGIYAAVIGLELVFGTGFEFVGAVSELFN
jgi:hypothetical protein